jgi:DNA repair protein RadD
MLALFPDQQKNFQELRQAFRRNKHVLFQAPTGYGKTVLSAAIAHGAASRGTRTCFCVHRQELIEQTCRTMEQCGIPYGVIAPHYKPNPNAEIQIASIFTLARRSGYDFDLIIYDECHHCAAGQWQKVAMKFPAASSLGLTATPIRMDGLGLGHYFEFMVQAPSMRQLTALGRLSPYEYWCPETVELSGLRGGKKDYVRKTLEKHMNKRAITGNCIQHYKRICDGQPFLCFCVSVEHSRQVAEEFRAAGYPVEALDGTMDRATRRGRVEALGKKLVGLTSCDLISEGFDVPAVVAAVLLRPTKSLGLYLQQVGRALRVFPGKKKAVILDCVGNVMKHGVPDADRAWSLTYGVKPEPQEKKEDEPDVRACPLCYAVHECLPACPYCGYEYPVKQREVKREEGELRKLTTEEIADLEKVARASGKLQDWHRLAKAKGYKPGWAYHQLKRGRRNSKLKNVRVGPWKKPL